MNYKVYVLEDDESIRELVTMALEMAQISIKSFSKIKKGKDKNPYLLK